MFPPDADPVIISTICSAIQPFKTSMEHQKHKYELLTEEYQTKENDISNLQEELSLTKEEKLQLKLENSKLQTDLFNLRYDIPILENKYCSHYMICVSVLVIYHRHLYICPENISQLFDKFH